MAKYTPKAARERGERFITSWQTNSPDKDWDNITLAQHKAKRKAILDVEAEIDAKEAETKALMIKRDNLNEAFMEDCDFVAAAVEGSREYGPDSALRRFRLCPGIRQKTQWRAEENDVVSFTDRKKARSKLAFFFWLFDEAV